MFTAYHRAVAELPPHHVERDYLTLAIINAACDIYVTWTR